ATRYSLKSADNPIGGLVLVLFVFSVAICLGLERLAPRPLDPRPLDSATPPTSPRRARNTPPALAGNVPAAAFPHPPAPRSEYAPLHAAARSHRSVRAAREVPWRNAFRQSARDNATPT